MCAKILAENFVTDRYLVSKLRALVSEAGFGLIDFKVTSRVIPQGDGGVARVDSKWSKIVRLAQNWPRIGRGVGG